MSVTLSGLSKLSADRLTEIPNFLPLTRLENPPNGEKVETEVSKQAPPTGSGDSSNLR